MYKGSSTIGNQYIAPFFVTKNQLMQKDTTTEDSNNVQNASDNGGSQVERGCHDCAETAKFADVVADRRRNDGVVRVLVDTSGND